MIIITACNKTFFFFYSRCLQQPLETRFFFFAKQFEQQQFIIKGSLKLSTHTERRAQDLRLSECTIISRQHALIICSHFYIVTLIVFLFFSHHMRSPRQPDLWPNPRDPVQPQRPRALCLQYRICPARRFKVHLSVQRTVEQCSPEMHK